MKRYNKTMPPFWKNKGWSSCGPEGRVGENTYMTLLTDCMVLLRENK